MDTGLSRPRGGEKGRGRQQSHTQATRAHGKREFDGVGQGEGESRGEVREAEVTDLGPLGERKRCQQEGYYGAKRVPFVLIKTGCQPSPVTHREALPSREALVSAAFSLII